MLEIEPSYIFTEIIVSLRGAVIISNCGQNNQPDRKIETVLRSPEAIISIRVIFNYLVFRYTSNGVDDGKFCYNFTEVTKVRRV